MTLVQKFLQGIGKDKLFLIEGDYYPFLITVDWFKALDRNGVIQDCYPFLLYKVGGVIKGYWNDTKYRGLASEVFDRYMSDGLHIPSFTTEYKKRCERVNTLYDSYYARLGAHSEEELLALFREVDAAFLDLTNLTLAFDTLDQDLIMEVVKKHGLSVGFPRIWQASGPTDFASFELRNAEELAENVHTKTPERHQHLFANYVHIPSFAETRAAVAGANADELAHEIQTKRVELEENRKEKQTLAEGMTEEEKRILKFIDWSGWIRDDRKTRITKCDVLFYNLTRDLYALWGLSEDLIPVSLIYEVLRGKNSVLAQKEVLEARKEKMVILYEGKDRYTEDPSVSDADIKLLDELYLQQHASAEANVLKGEVASKGKASGIVRIITGKSQFDRFCNGEILVTGMTRPEFVPLMKKAAAIVTDEGGITSHAAIVSRELKKPCIIGTKIATRVLKDGDRVEVDAEEGVVRILEQTK